MLSMVTQRTQMELERETLDASKLKNIRNSRCIIELGDLLTCDFDGLSNDYSRDAT